jgi:hypothetical protein
MAALAPGAFSARSDGVGLLVLPATTLLLILKILLILSQIKREPPKER